ncbi:hypothetical protein OF83DRAFT_1061559, partial [Amylostereum chailletii]
TKRYHFFDEILLAKRWFMGRLPPPLKGRVTCYNSRRGPGTKARVLRRFGEKDADISFASEAAGMGCDVAELDFVVQFRVPGSLSIWLQRAGRGKDRQASAYLLVQPSIFSRRENLRG